MIVGGAANTRNNLRTFPFIVGIGECGWKAEHSYEGSEFPRNKMSSKMIIIVDEKLTAGLTKTSPLVKFLKSPEFIICLWSANVSETTDLGEMKDLYKMKRFGLGDGGKSIKSFRRFYRHSPLTLTYPVVLIDNNLANVSHGNFDFAMSPSSCQDRLFRDTVDQRKVIEEVKKFQKWWKSRLVEPGLDAKKRKFK